VGVGKAVTGASSLLVNAMIARLLAVESVGVYNLAFSIAMFSSMLAQMGMNRAVIRLVAESVGSGRPGRARAAIRIVFAFGLGGSVAVGALLAFGIGPWLANAVFESEALAAIMTGVGVWTAFLALQTLVSETFRGFQNLKLAAVYGGVVSGVLCAVVFLLGWLLWTATTLEVVVWVTIAALAVSLVLAAFALRRRVRALGSPEPMALREVTEIAWPLLVTNLVAHALMQADVWLLGAFGTETELGIYGMTVRLVRLVAIPLMIINLLVPPFVAELYFAGDRGRLQRVLRGTATLAGLPAAVVLLGFILFGGPILGLVFGEEYRQGALVLTVLSLGRLVQVWSGSCQTALSMTGHQKALMRITAVNGLLTLAAMYFAVRSFGMPGVAVAASAGVVVQSLSAWIAARKLTGLWTHAGIPTRAEIEELRRRLLRR
jgi:O-antigen/teichoic acid export membrane protein